MTKSKERKYSWGLITYTNEEAIKRFVTEQCRNWAYIYHDKDNKEPHWHVVTTFDQPKSFASVIRIFKSYINDEQNVMAEPIRDLGDALLYLTHETPQATQEGKHQYDRNDLRIISRSFYEKYVKGEDGEEDNFVEDLLAPKAQFSVIRMAKMYGRDFMKNMRSYMEFRRVALAERSGINAIDTLHSGFSCTELDEITRNNEAVNSVLKGV